MSSTKDIYVSINMIHINRLNKLKILWIHAEKAFEMRSLSVYDKLSINLE